MKEVLRKKYLSIRKGIDNKELKDKEIFNKVIHNSKVNKSHKVLIYVSLEDEVDTLNLIKYFLDNSYVVGVPKVNKDIMEFHYLNSLEELREGYKGILEPQNADVIKDFQDFVCLTPGICFDKMGYRIGYGKGYYDKFFRKNQVYKIGLSYKELVIDNVYHNNLDINVDEIITD